MSQVSKIISVLWLSMMLAGCGGEEAAETACVPGQSAACACEDGNAGAQQCLEDGSGYQACVCSNQNKPSTEENESPVEEGGEATEEEGGESTEEEGGEAPTEEGGEAATEEGGEAATEEGGETPEEEGGETTEEEGGESTEEEGGEAPIEEGGEATEEEGGESTEEQGGEATEEEGGEVSTEEGGETTEEEGGESTEEEGGEATEEEGGEATEEEGGEAPIEEGGEATEEEGGESTEEQGGEAPAEEGGSEECVSDPDCETGTGTKCLADNSGYQVCTQVEPGCYKWNNGTDCGANEECSDGACVCVPQCTGKNCGEDGCGGTCGACGEFEVCTDGTCTVNCVSDPGCTDATTSLCLGDNLVQKCQEVASGCYQWALPETCPQGEGCANGACGCIPQCAGKQCGPDACGGVCGTCANDSTCNEGSCEVNCVSDAGCNGAGILSCADNGVVSCEEIEPGCFKWSTPTNCADTEFCEAGVCKPIPNDELKGEPLENADCVVIEPFEVRSGDPNLGSVAVAFGVYTCDGEGVLDLEASDISLKENGVGVSPTESSATLLNRNAEAYITLVLDNSPSVAASGALEDTVAGANAFVDRLFEGNTVTTFVRVAYFSKNFVVKQDFTNKPAEIESAINGLLTDNTGFNTTNLYGAVLEAVSSNTLKQSARYQSMKGGVLTLGQIVVFTDGNDNAGLSTLEEASAAVQETRDDVVMIALGGEVSQGPLTALGKSGSYSETNSAALQSTFETVADFLTSRKSAQYILGYCTPKLAGIHELTLSISEKGASLPVEFDATGFDAEGVPSLCSAATWLYSCEIPGEIATVDASICCGESPTPGCPSHPTCANLVCETMPECCDTAWSAACVEEANAVCLCEKPVGMCGNQWCEDGENISSCIADCGCSSGNCNPYGVDCCSSAGCPESPGCAELVCPVDPYCCEGWDGICATFANQYCPYQEFVCAIPEGESCGDGVCDEPELSGVCPIDCGCPDGMFLQPDGATCSYGLCGGLWCGGCPDVALGCKQDGSCECPPNRTGLLCEECSGGWTGENCDVCPDNWGGTNCNLCAPNWTGEECSACNTSWTGENCDMCPDNWGGTNCDVCAPNWTGEGCSACNNAWTGENCDICPENWGGTNCNVCAENFKGTDCSECNDQWVGNWTGEDCDICPDNWVGENCDTCANAWTGENCDTCANAWTGENCDICPDNWAGENCDTCSPGWVGPQCNQEQFVKLGLGTVHSCGIKSDQTVVCWGGSGFTNPPAVPFLEVTGGDHHACGITQSKDIVCWGEQEFADEYGQSTLPAGKFEAISAYGKHNCALKSDGTIACWGSNWDGESTAPEGQFLAISCGFSHNCGIRVDNTLECWGYEQEPPPPPQGLFKAVSSGLTHSCAIRMDGTVACWGYGTYGLQSGPTGVYEKITSGGGHMCALTAEGNGVCLGEFVGEFPQGSFTEVSSGETHACAIKADGSVICWGDNSQGQLNVPTF